MDQGYDADSGIVTFVRRGKTAKNQMMVICNFVPVERKDYRVGVPCLTTYTEILNSDDEKFGGLGRTNKGRKLVAEEAPCDRSDKSMVLDIPPLSTIILKYDYKN